MAKRSTTEDHLALLRNLRASQGAPADIAALRQLLQTPRLHGIAVKSIADLADKWAAKDLTSDLAAIALELAGADAQKRDPGAEGKQAVLRTLVNWESDVPDLFLKASHWKQLAPVMAGAVDVAAECRGLAAVGIALTQPGGPETALSRIIDLLVDEAPATRARAAQALGLWRGPEAASLLRLKALMGDEAAEVLGEVFLALLHQDPSDSAAAVSFVSRFLDHEDPHLIEAATMALGESRQAAALPAMTAAWDRLGRDPVRTSVTMAIALLRSEESLAWLLSRIEQGRESAALEALEALRLYRGNDKATARIRDAVSGKEALTRLFNEIFAQ